MLKVLAIVMLVVASGCAPASRQAERRAEQLLAVWRTGETAPLDSILAEGVVYDDLPNATQYRGRDEVRAYVGHVHAWAGEVSLEVIRLAGHGREATAEWVMRGVQDAPIAGRLPIATNRPFEIRGVTLVTLDEAGRIIRAADYMDVLRFVLDLGGDVTLPGGVPLGSPSP